MTHSCKTRLRFQKEAEAFYQTQIRFLSAIAVRTPDQEATLKKYREYLETARDQIQEVKNEQTRKPLLKKFKQLNGR